MTARHREPLVHHELCFGCGRTNLFGLLSELERPREGLVTGRCFVKQDHQGAEPGVAHEGVLVAALSEAMSFACGQRMRTLSLELSIEHPVPVGTFIEVEAQAIDAPGPGCRASASASTGGRRIATASGLYEPI